MKKIVLALLPLSFTLLVIFILFLPFFRYGLVPMPADITVGLYYPWLDYKWGYEVGVPVKNPLLSDIPSLLYPWRSFAVDQLKAGEFPLWNPFYFAGMPLLANFQSAVFSWVNVFFLFLPKVWAWSTGIVIQSFLAALLTYLFLCNRKLSRFSSLLGGIVFALSGFSIAWMEYDVHGHTAYFLPLLLFLVDEYFEEEKTGWLLGFSFAVAFQIFAGYLPIVIYSYLIIVFYVFVFHFKLGKLVKLGLFGILGMGLAAVQLLPGWELLRFSIRDVDPIVRASNASFLPFSHLVTLVAPDFFGNPVTYNYWGKAFYDNFAFWIGTAALTLVFLALFNSLENKFCRFWGIVLLFSLVLVTKNPLGVFLQKILFLEGGVAARALFITDFSLAILAGCGLEALMKEKKKILKQLATVLILVGGMMGVIWTMGLMIENPVNRLIALRNLVIPTAVFLFSIPLLFGIMFSKKSLPLCLFASLPLFLVSCNLLYHAKKYLPFSKPEFVFPPTPVIEFLQKQEKPFRFEPGDVIPQDMWMPYGLEAASGSDALLPKRMGEFSTAIETGRVQKNISRVQLITNYDSPLFSLLNAKYISVKKVTEKGIYSPEGKPPERFLDKSRYKLVFEDKTVQVYEDLKRLPRAFWVYDFEVIKDGQEIVSRLQVQEFDTKKKIILEENPNFILSSEKAKKQEIEWLEYRPGRLKMVVNSDQPGFVFLANNFYPGWESFVDSQKTKIYRADYTFQAIKVPEGRHLIEFFYQPKSFLFGGLISGFSCANLMLIAGFSLIRYLWVRKYKK